jgi:hypothetical protein
MTWEERINNNTFSIKTGDGELYFPLFKQNTELEKEFNTSVFEFINVYGTLVDRKKPQGRKFTLVFYFEGSDCITNADKFEFSCDDPRAWKVNHPYYGLITGQPMSIKRDDTSLNVTEITVPFYETIELDYPFVNYSPKDNTREKHRKTLASFETIDLPFDEAVDIPKNQERVFQIQAEMQGLQNNNTYSDFQNALNTALKAIDKTMSDPLAAFQTIQNFLDLPAMYEQAVLGRVSSYVNVYYRLKNSIETLSDKKNFEGLGGSLIASMGLAMVLPIVGDYFLISDVFRMRDTLKDIYNDYLETLDTLQVSIYDVTNAYSPNPEAQTNLSSLVQYTLDNLYNLSFETKRERIVYVDKKTNVILLAHRYLGLDVDDLNIDIFIKTNNITLNELFSIEKGRQIKYAK